MVYYHAHCLDGFAAAYVAWKSLGSTADYRGLQHGDSWQDEEIRGRHVYVLDFSFSPAAVELMLELAESVTILDHHVTAKREWEIRPPGPENLFLKFELSQSGAGLAWRHFYPDQACPRLLLLVEDQDLWRFKFPESRPIAAAIHQQAFTFEHWDILIQACEKENSSEYLSLLKEGEVILAFQMKAAQQLAESQLVMPVALKGERIDPLQSVRHAIPVINDAVGDTWRLCEGLAINASSVFASQLGHFLAEKSNCFGLVWQMTGRAEVRVSLRAAGKVNVAEIAANYQTV